MDPRFDLRREVPWIPVTYLDGRRESLPLQTTLERAHLLREIAAEPATWAALMRFLPSVVALIARTDPHADFDDWADHGIPHDAIATALDAIASHLWLRHPDTPFMQEPLLATAGEPNTTEWLHLVAPGANSKAWWGKKGDHTRADAGTLARIAQGLVVSWYFSPGVSGKALGHYADASPDDSGWRPRGTTGFHNHGLRIFHRGDTLAQTLLANTMESHLDARRGGNLPLWATTGDALPATPLTASTWTGSVYLLAWDGDECTGVHVGGRRLPGAPTKKDARRQYVKAVEDDVWRADPTVPRVPVMKAGEETGEVRPIRALHPSASPLQWAAEWYAADERRNAARPLEPGLIEVATTDAFVFRLAGDKAGPELDYYSRIGELSAVANPRARGRLASLSSMVVTPIRGTLYVGLVKALGEEVARPLHDRMFAAFCTEAEPILDDLLHAETLDRAHAAAFTDAARTAFEDFLDPYLSSRTLGPRAGVEGIAAAIAFVEKRIRTTLREVRL